MENKEWFLYVVDHHEGPFSAEEIKKLVKKGDARNSSYVWKEGYADWVMMSDVTEFGPGLANSDGHGPFSFITGIFSRKKKPAAPAAGSGAAAASESTGGSGFTASGPDISDVRPSDSIWCLSSQHQFSGPYSMKNIVRKVNAGEVSAQDSVWRDGWKSFVTIANIPGFREQIDPDALTGKVDKKKKGKGNTAAASAMGLNGKASVAKSRWYNSRGVRLLLLVGLPATIYQLTLLGHLNPLLEKVPAAKAVVDEQVKALELKPIPFDKAFESLAFVKEMAGPLLQNAAVYLPEPLQGFFAVIQIPEGVKPADAETLREVAGSDLKNGIRVASALPPGEEINPQFLISSNAPDGTSFRVTLRGKEGTLINATAYEKVFEVEINKHLVTTPRFALDGNKPLPKGEYVLLVHESDEQNPEVAKVLAAAPKKTVPPIVPKGKVAFVVDNFFLGGKRDANYETRLKEFQEKIKARMTTELAELKQYTLFIEQIANESATKFDALSQPPVTPQKKAQWQHYHLSYAKMSDQVKGALAKFTPETKKDYALPHLYQKLEAVYQLSERLHQTETDVIEKGGNRDSINAVAVQTVEAIGDLKAAIFKLIK